MKNSKIITSTDARALRPIARNFTLLKIAATALAEVRASFPRGRPATPSVTVVATHAGLPDAVVIVIGASLLFVSSRVCARYIGLCLKVLQRPNPGVTGKGWVFSARLRDAAEAQTARATLANRLGKLAAQHGPAAPLPEVPLD